MQDQDTTNLQDLCNRMKPLSEALSASNHTNCAICHHLLQVPIMLLEKLGNVCESCFVKENIRSKAMRNTALEFIIERLPFPCRYQGCKKEDMYKELKEHEKGCELGPIRCLYDSCDWNNSVAMYPNHFERSHGTNVINEINGEFTVYIEPWNLKNNVYCLKGKNRHHFLQIFKVIDYASHMENVFFLIFENSCNNGFPSGFALKFIGSDKLVTMRQSSSLRGWQNDNTLLQKTIAIPVLKALCDESDSLLALIIKKKITSSARESILASVVHEKVKHYLECPICVDIMKPPIYLCRTGHSFCRVCKSRLTECPSCKSTHIYTRNYALEQLTAEIFYKCHKCNEMIVGKLLEEHEKTCNKS